MSKVSLYEQYFQSFQMSVVKPPQEILSLQYLLSHQI